MRTALRPRFLALLAAALLLASAFAWLGDWQLGRARDEATQRAVEQALSAPVAELTDVLAPAQPLTGDVVRRRVSVAGRLDPDAALRVPDRQLDGVDGAWLLAPLAVDGTDGTLPVVLGWLPEDAEPPPVPAGGVELVGRLEQSEPPAGVDPEDVTRTLEVPAVSSADLVNLWEPPLYTAYLVVTDPAPDPPLHLVPPSEPTSGFALQNLSYALQWWLFAAFAVYLWWRVVRDASAQQADGVQREWTA